MYTACCEACNKPQYEIILTHWPLGNLKEIFQIQFLFKQIEADFVIDG